MFHQLALTNHLCIIIFSNFRYDFVSECESTAPSAVFVTPSPTPIPTLSTSVSYTFYIEHSADKLKGEVTYDMSFGVRDVLESYLGGKEDILYGYAVNHELAIEHISANMVSPTEIGCEFGCGLPWTSSALQQL